MCRHATARRAFTLREIVVLVTLLLVGAGLLFPAVSRARADAAKAASENNLKQIGLAVVGAAEASNARVPPAGESWYPGPRRADTNGYGACFFHLLPYLEQEPLFNNSRVAVGKHNIYAGW